MEKLGGQFGNLRYGGENVDFLGMFLRDITPLLPALLTLFGFHFAMKFIIEGLHTVSVSLCNYFLCQDSELGRNEIDCAYWNVSQ